MATSNNPENKQLPHEGNNLGQIINTMHVQQRDQSSWDGVVSSRTSTALKSQGIRTFREVAAMNRRELFKLPMIGKLAMREIDRALHERGFSYADGPAMIPTEITAKPLSNAERQQRYRAKHTPVDVGEQMATTISRLARDFDLTEAEVTRHLIRFALCNRNWDETGFPSMPREHR